MDFFILGCGALIFALAGAGIAFAPELTLAVILVAFASLIFMLIPVRRIVGFSACAALTVLIVVPVQNIGSYGNLKYIALACVVGLVVGAIIRRHPSVKGRLRGLWLFSAYFGLVALATPRSTEPSAWLLFLGAVVAGLGPAILSTMSNMTERKSLANFLVYAGALEAAYAVFEMVAGPPPIWGQATVSDDGAPKIMYNQILSGFIRAQGTMGHPLPLALLLLVSLALLVRGVGPNSGRWKFVVGALLVMGCFAAGSRSALAIAIVLVFLGVGRNRWKAVGVGSYLLILVALFATAAGFLESDVYQRFVTSDSLSHRSGAIDAVPGLLENQGGTETFFGNGYFSAYELYRAGLLQVGNFFAVDNQFVMTLVEGGVFGVALLIGLIFVAIKRINPAVRLGLAAVVVFFLTFDVLSWPSGMGLFGAFIGLAVSEAALGEPKKAAGPGYKPFAPSKLPASQEQLVGPIVPTAVS